MQYVFEAIGTRWRINIDQPVSDQESDVLWRAVRRRIGVFDRHYSRFRSDSLVAAMAEHAGTYQLPRDAGPLLDFYHALYRLTSGLVTPLVGQTLVDRGYDAHYTLQPKATIASVPSWDEVLTRQGTSLTMRRPALLDFGAAGKGYALDIVGKLLKRRGIANFSINAGGDILHSTTAGRAIELGLEHPSDPSRIIGMATIANQSLCGSATSKRAWGAYHHIVDPRHSASPRRVVATWVVAQDGLVADGLATALFLVPPQTLLNNYSFAYAVVRSDLSIAYSADFPGKFFTREEAHGY